MTLSDRITDKALSHDELTRKKIGGEVLMFGINIICKCLLPFYISLLLLNTAEACSIPLEPSSTDTQLSCTYYTVKERETHISRIVPTCEGALHYLVKR